MIQNAASFSISRVTRTIILVSPQQTLRSITSVFYTKIRCRFYTKIRCRFTLYIDVDYMSENGTPLQGIDYIGIDYIKNRYILHLLSFINYKVIFGIVYTFLSLPASIMVP